MKAKHWYDYLWVYAIIYFALGFFNILFAWLGMIDFLLPLFLAIFGGNKFFCNHLCGRGQLFSKLGTDLKCSRCKPTPRWMSSKWFRYGFLIFFLTMFGSVVFQTYLVAAGAASLREAIKLFWTFRVPWGWTYTAGTVADWVAQFSFGFYSLMLTSLLLGLIVMVLYKPRTWCAFCPMGTMTQGICKLKNKEYTPDEMMQMSPPEERFKSLSLGPNIQKSLQTGEMDIEGLSQADPHNGAAQRGNAL